jgi:hypothetical protein
MNGTTPETNALREALSNEEYGLMPAIKDVAKSFNGMVNTITGENKTAMENFTTMLAGWAYLLGGIANALEKVISKTTTLIGKYKELNEEHPWNNPMTGFGSLFNKKATGGIASGMTLVGEAGPELVNLPRGSHVYNNTDSKEMVGGGDIVINVNAPVTGVDNLRATIIEAVNEATARQNRLANYNLL